MPQVVAGCFSSIPSNCISWLVFKASIEIVEMEENNYSNRPLTHVPSKKLKDVNAFLRVNPLNASPCKHLPTRTYMNACVIVGANL